MDQPRKRMLATFDDCHMRFLTLCGVFVFPVIVFAQCGREYPSGFWHNDTVVTANGDTINLLDSAGYYHGMHVYSDDPDCRMLDTVAYTYGLFEHGRPVDDWVEHCPDGSYWMGPYTWGEQLIVHPDGRKEQKKQGIYCKVGEWRYYGVDGVLQRTLRYRQKQSKKDEACWERTTEVLDERGKWRTIHYKRNGPGVYNTPTHRSMEASWRDDGTPISIDRKHAHRYSDIDYHPNGRVKEKHRVGWSIWYFHHRSVTRTYNEAGELLNKKVTLRKSPPKPRLHDEDDVF